MADRLLTWDEIMAAAAKIFRPVKPMQAGEIKLPSVGSTLRIRLPKDHHARTYRVIHDSASDPEFASMSEHDAARLADAAAGYCGLTPKPIPAKPVPAPFPRNALRREWGGF